MDEFGEVAKAILELLFENPFVTAVVAMMVGVILFLRWLGLVEPDSPGHYSGSGDGGGNGDGCGGGD